MTTPKKAELFKVGRVKDYPQWHATAALGQFRAMGEFSLYWHGIGLVLGPGFGLTLFLLFCEIEVLIWRMDSDANT